MKLKRKGYLLDVGYIARNNKTYARLTIRAKKIINLYLRYDPYFYVDPSYDNINLNDAINQIKQISINHSGRLIKPKKIEIVEVIVGGKNKKLIKIYAHTPPDVPILKQFTHFKHYEFAIPFSRRVLMDFNLIPMALIKYVREGQNILSIDKVDEDNILKPKMFSLDIETYNKEGMPNPDIDPIIMVSYSIDGKPHVLTYKSTHITGASVLNSEYDILYKLSELIQKEDPDLIVGYNTTNFDIPYIADRVKKLGITDFKLGTTPQFRHISKGQIKGLKIPGRIHIDLYSIVRFFGHAGIINTQNYRLKEVYQNITGKPPVKVEQKDIWEMWDSSNPSELNNLVKYSLSDAKITYEVAEYVIPIVQELSQTTRMLLFDASLATAGQFVESLLMYRAKKHNMIIPPRPKEFEIQSRMSNPIVGAFVKLPEPGIYENIVVLDFRGLYPSIITSYNIDPYTLVLNKNDKHPDSKYYQTPTDARFLKSPKGLIPEVLEELIVTRSKIKKQIKEMKNDPRLKQDGSKTHSDFAERYKRLKSRSQALKILSNSFYGYLVYARSRWYCRPCGESVTALGRKHIKETMDEAKKWGFSVLYGDTDSLFILRNGKSKNDVLKFLKYINDNLPGTMELELEDFYTRGVFVSKKGEGGKGAKKKYALLSENGNIKIRGFELVRRDWSLIARETQYKVLEAILKDGSKEEAVSIVRDIINKLKKRQIPLQKLIISTQLNKDPDNYAVISPELAAAKKLESEGKKIKKGMLIEYIISNTGKSISEKAIPLEIFKSEKHNYTYDADYYINNQILPSVLKILGELGYDEYALKEGGKQKGLSSWM